MLTHTYRPVGGVVKTVDYAAHARAAGLDVTLWSPERLEPDAPLAAHPGMSALLDDSRVQVEHGWPEHLGADDLALISLPTVYEHALRALGPGLSPARIVHLVQHVRHADPRWLAGYATRLLTRPATRISTNAIVAEAIEPWLDPRAMHRVIDLGHDLDHFRGPARVEEQPLCVGYTTWKTDAGDRVAAALAGDERFRWAAVREHTTWDELRDFYASCDVFLCTPDPTEGLYLPGLEAMAAGCVVVTPDAVGNRAYAEPDENCLLVGHEDVAGYVATLERLAADPATRTRLRDAGTATAEAWPRLPDEQAAFADVLGALRERLESVVS